MRTALAILAVMAAVSASGCGGGASKPTSTRGSATSTRGSATSTRGSATASSMQVSSDFKPGRSISAVHTCDGHDVSPPLQATGLPAATKEIVVVMHDPDAPGGNFIHWAVANLMPAHGSLSLPAGAAPPGAVLGRNSFGSLGYRGPCPPSGPAHHYVITVYALAQPSGLKRAFSGDDVNGMPALAQGSLTGLYARR